MLKNFILGGEKVVVLFLLFILSACSHTIAEKEAPAVNEMKSGEKFDIILPENHTEGYLWKLKDGYNKSVIDNLGAVWHGNDNGIYFRFVAAQAGIDTLHFVQFKTDAVTKERDSVKTAVYIIKVTE